MKAFAGHSAPDEDVEPVEFFQDNKQNLTICQSWLCPNRLKKFIYYCNTNTILLLLLYDLSIIVDYYQTTLIKQANNLRKANKNVY